MGRITRRNLHARLSDEAFNGWVEFAQQHGVSLSGLLEAIGRHYARGGETTAVGLAAVEAARQIDGDNRSRRGKRSG